MRRQGSKPRVRCLQATGNPHDREETVSGFLIVSKCRTFLRPSNDQRQRAISVVAPGLGEQFLKTLPPHAGSMVTYAGAATVTGQICKSGLDPMSHAFRGVRTLTFRSAHGMEASYQPEESVPGSLV